MRALVTGSAGFVGRHMVHELRARGWLVAEADIRTGSDALSLFRREQARFDLVVHCAANSPHRAAIDGQPMSLAHNLMLDSAMFDWAVRTSQRRVLYLSSSAAYPVRLQTQEWLDAHGPCRLAEHLINVTQWGGTGDWSPDASYGWTKLTGERLAAAARMAGLPVTVVRPFSGYGEDQGTDWPFGAFVERARRRDDPFVIWGPGSQVRDWVHIDDVVCGALAVVESGTTEPVNLCTGVGTSMFDLAWMCCQQVRHVTATLAPQPSRPTGVLHRVGDPTRFRLYWTPKVDLAEGVRRALED